MKKKRQNNDREKSFCFKKGVDRDKLHIASFYILYYLKLTKWVTSNDIILAAPDVSNRLREKPVGTRCTSNPRHFHSSANIPRFLPDDLPPISCFTGRLVSSSRNPQYRESFFANTARWILDETYVNVMSRKISIFQIALVCIKSYKNYVLIFSKDFIYIHIKMC